MHVHKHDEEGIQESTAEARGDINSYFDDLDRKERIKDEQDRADLDKHREFAAPSKKLSTADSNHDLDSYFHSLKKTHGDTDAADRARLRKDNAKVNWHEGVNLAKHPLPAKAKKGEEEGKQKAAAVRKAAAKVRVAAKK